MNKILKFTGGIFWFVLIALGSALLYQNFQNIVKPILVGIGIVSILLILVRLYYGRQWLSGLGKEFVVGNDLIKATENFLSDLPKPKNETTANLIGHIVYRFTRLGLVGLALASIPIWLLFQQNGLLQQQNERFDLQNELITKQNKRLDQQTYLQEADRRSALIFIYGNLLETINRELSENEEKTGKRILSSQVIGQIIALSQRLKPYRYLENDSLIIKPLSPERSQLLISLIESRLDSATYLDIYKKADFSYSDLDGVNIEGQDLRYINLSHSNLSNANLRRVKLDFANLQFSEINSADFVDASLYLTNLSYSNIDKSDFRLSKIKSAILESSIIKNSTFNFAKIKNSTFENSKIQNSYFENIYVDSRNRIENGDPCEPLEISFGNWSFGDNYENVADTLRKEIDSLHHIETSFRKTFLKNVNFSESNLAGINFNLSQIENSIFNKSNLTGVSLDSVTIKNTTFNYSLFNGTSFTQTDLSSINFNKSIITSSLVQPQLIPFSRRIENYYPETIYFNIDSLTKKWTPINKNSINFYDSLFQANFLYTLNKNKDYSVDSITRENIFNNTVTVQFYNFDESDKNINFDNSIKISEPSPFWWSSFLAKDLGDQSNIHFLYMKSVDR